MLYIIMNKNICCGLEETCFRCDRGWKLNKRKCYYFSKDRLSWNESKVMCMNQSGNLVKITSKDEQVQKHTKMKENEDKFWIGLTDAAKEGEWRWVDGSKLNEDPRYWSGNEPDNWKGENNEHPEGENCVRMGEKGQTTILESWFDQFCKTPHKRICEKAAESGKRSSVCVSETRVK
uniref:C-type lectin domain-containing protein n=1 Tax=Gouania willdenowi TaxID=441366 RepID=A0A8C5DPY1_GOUWI